MALAQLTQTDEERKMVPDITGLFARILYGHRAGAADKAAVHACLKGAATWLAVTAPTTKRGITTPIRAAVVYLMKNTEDRDALLARYRALSLLDYANMTVPIQVLCRQIEKGSPSPDTPYDLLARAVLAFHPANAALTRIVLRDNTTERLLNTIRIVLKADIKAGRDWLDREKGPS